MTDTGLRGRYDIIDPSLSTIPGTVLGFILFSTLFLTRFGLSSSGSHSELALVLVALLLGVMMLAITGLIEISIPRTVLYAVAMGAMLLSTMLGSTGKTSATSLLNLIALYFCFLFVVPSDRLFEHMILLFRKFVLFIAFVAIFQFVAQIAIPGPTLFTWLGVLPDNVLTHGFNNVIPSGIANLNKANGFFLVEPSSLSQMTTLAIIIEIDFFRLRPWRLGILGLALMLSFSGTGLIMFGLVVPWLLVARGRGSILILAIPIALLALIVTGIMHVDTTFSRLSEFDSDQSSAFARFLSPFYLFHDYVFQHMRTALFGLGPGSIEAFFNITSYEIHDPTWGKLLFEYGLVGTIPFMIFVLYCFFAGARSVALNAALFIQYLVLGGNLLDARVNALILVIAVFQNRPGWTKTVRLPYWDPRRVAPILARVAPTVSSPLSRETPRVVPARAALRRIGVPDHPAPPKGLTAQG
jgi:hypothetical protein